MLRRLVGKFFARLNLALSFLLEFLRNTQVQCAGFATSRVLGLPKDPSIRLQHRRMLKDRNAARLIRLGGLTVLAALLLILWHLLSVILPLFGAPELRLEDRWETPANQQVLMVTEDIDSNILVSKVRNTAASTSGIVETQSETNSETKLANPNATLTPQCSVLFSRRSATSHEQTWKPIKRLPFACDKRVLTFQNDGSYYLAELADSGMLRVYEMVIYADKVSLHRKFSYLLSDVNIARVEHWQILKDEQRWAVILRNPRTADKSDTWLFWFNPESTESQRHYFYRGAKQVLADGIGGVFINFGERIEYRDSHNQVLWQHSSDAGIAAITMFPSTKAIMLVEQNGQVSKWSLTNKRDSVTLTKRYSIASITQHGHSESHVRSASSEHSADASLITFYPQNTLGLISNTEQITLFNTVTGEVLNRQVVASLLNNTAAIEQQPNLTVSPARQSSLAVAPAHLTESGAMHAFWLDQRFAIRQGVQVWEFVVAQSSAVLTLSNLFGAIQYDGYDTAEYIWQSSTGTDGSQPKYSVIPLVIGSIKAAFLALLVAIPTGLGAAIYSAYFASSDNRKWLKPTIEMLEAIPSVIIGFIATVWLLPLDEEQLASIFSFLFFLPVLGVVFIWLNNALQQRFAVRLPLNIQWCFIYLLAFALVLSQLVPLVMKLMTQLQIPALFFLPEQDSHSKNTIVVAVALGIAIAPSIYSLAEDAIFEVPKSLRRASYALGASRIQTLTNVVLKVAFPGILSAVMLGFSRALGETMILLMVTGNTPIAEWDLMAGMRTLTANLAIELPESAVGSAHYRVLFVTAFLLLVFTMTINTIAELLRLRFRKRYRHG